MIQVSRDAISNENEILEDAINILRNDGIHVSMNQMKHLYSTIIGFINEAMRVPEILGIVFPHIGTSYVTPRTLKKTITKTKIRDRFIAAIVREKLNYLLTKNTYLKLLPRLNRLNKRLTNGSSFYDVVNNQNMDYER